MGHRWDSRTQGCAGNGEDALGTESTRHGKPKKGQKTEGTVYKIWPSERLFSRYKLHFKMLTKKKEGKKKEYNLVLTVVPSENWISNHD